MLFGLTYAELEKIIIDWFNATGWKIAVVLVAIFIFKKFGNLLISRGVRRAVEGHAYASKAEEKQREDTLISILTTLAGVLIWIIGVMTILSTIGFDIGPLMASAGVLGVAIGFGAQDLIKDFVAGLYIIMENHYRVGDVVSLDGTSGEVLRISLRETVLRDLDGNVHHIPNGSFDIATNMTFEYSQINLDVGVGYNTDLDQLEKVINEVGVDLAKDPKWSEVIVEAPAFLRIDELGDSAIVAKVLGKTKPMKQWAVMGELRKRYKIAFDKAGIEIPFPQMVIHHPEKSSKKK